MTSKTKPEAETENRPAAEAAAPAAPTADSAEQAGGEQTGADQAAVNDNAFEVLTKLQAENAELKDRLLRAMAEIENVRRRGEREVSDARQYAIAKFAGDMLGVADNMERALASVPSGARETDAAVKALMEGVELTEKEMLRSLEKHGVKKLDPKGERFDPNFHQAMFEVPDPSVPNGTVAQVVQVGYSIGSRVLRPAMVGVARGGPKQAAEAEKQA
ncbi:nucleotide exchange factor GrpE [Labrys sp. LIt4]|uniref:Protein GrpE n=1 Tax=Labrys okinawensis TaxID=346911 RepID=A0A2S9QGA6_9HYPH|nr:MULTISPECIES: nucleotide exchange factor GrpE [Labrys]MBP0579816.1 nucleotide exchange factor GrpE [Labrys sp. LIt4]PRH88369.1 nucleotide exchange factor GrpE [Labrys okinawensis]